jgi:dihydrofolate synthase / folylpolyglutamate synthase
MPSVPRTVMPAGPTSGHDRRGHNPSVAWLESLSPWPKDGFGLERMRALLAELGNPQLAYPSIHVVGTNGKSTTTRAIEATLLREGSSVGAYTSPHVTGWAERIRVNGHEACLEHTVLGVRAPAVALAATQFEVLTAAALAAFAEAGVEAAVVEAGLGGRYDATNVLRSPVQVLTNVSLEHTDVLGPTREAIAVEKLAVVQPGSTVVLGEAEWESIALGNGAAQVVVEPGGNVALAGVAASAFLGRPVEPVPVTLPGRLERRGEEIWDGAHTPEAVRYIASDLPPLGSVVASILADKDVEGVLSALASLSRTFVATASSSERALSAGELAERARPYFSYVEAVEDTLAALRRAHELGEPVLVTGSLYLLADLTSALA